MNKKENKKSNTDKAKKVLDKISVNVFTMGFFTFLGFIGSIIVIIGIEIFNYSWLLFLLYAAFVFVMISFTIDMFIKNVLED